jgi:lysozyme family protein
MAYIKVALRTVFGNEGGFQDDPDDNGNWTGDKCGEGILKGTKFGISGHSYPHLDIKNLTIERAAKIYEVDFWRPLRLNEVWEQKVATEIFDTAVNCGIITAIKIWQRAINIANYPNKDLVVDGIVGEKTLDATNHFQRLSILMKSLNGFQFMRYHEIIEKNPKKEKFAASWISRT